MKNTFTEIVAATVRAKAAVRQVTSKEISAKTGITPATLSRRMNGHSPWNTDELEKVAMVLECPPSDLVPLSPGSPDDWVTAANE